MARRKARVRKKIAATGKAKAGVKKTKSAKGKFTGGGKVGGGTSGRAASNVNRKATAETFSSLVPVAKRLAGVVIQGHRAYEAPSKGGKGYTQKEVANGIAGCTQTTVSSLENGKKIPADGMLRKILVKCGFDLAKPGGKAFFQLLRVLRDNGSKVAKLRGEVPI